MTEQNEAVKNYQYDLLAELLTFSFRLRHEKLAKPVEVIVVMKPYENREMIQMLKEKAGHLQQAKDDAEAYDVKEGDADAAWKFFDKHFVKAMVGGKILTTEQFSKMDARYDLRNSVIDAGYNGIRRYTEDVENLQSELDIDVLIGDATVKMVFSLVIDGKERNIIIPQIFNTPTAMDSLQYERAQVQQGIRGGGFRVSTNHEALTTLYNKLIQSCHADGCGLVLGTQPCVGENKEEWVAKVPYTFKRAALQFLFSRAERAIQGN